MNSVAGDIFFIAQTGSDTHSGSFKQTPEFSLA
jgi:hypothetical protein